MPSAGSVGSLFGSGAANGAAGGGGMWSAIIPALVSLAGMYFGNKNKDGSQQQQMQNLMTPEMQEMLQLQLDRMKGQKPLYDDVMGMARGMLPTRYRVGLPTVSDPPIPNPGGPGTDERQRTPNAIETGRKAIPRIPKY